MTMSERRSSNTSNHRDFSIDAIIGRSAEKDSERLPRNTPHEIGKDGHLLLNRVDIATSAQARKKIHIPISTKPTTTEMPVATRIPEALRSHGNNIVHPRHVNYGMDPRMFFPPSQSVVHPLHHIMVNSEFAAAAHPHSGLPWNLERLAGLYPHPGLTVPTNPAFLFHPYRKPKRVRTAFTPSQLLQLEHAFEKNHYVVGQERKDLAAELKLSETQVKVWFQNRRTKFKRTRSDDESQDNDAAEDHMNEGSYHDDEDEEDISVDSDGSDYQECPDNVVNLPDTNR